jgi:hypothetical protein
MQYFYLLLFHPLKHQWINLPINESKRKTARIFLLFLFTVYAKYATANAKTKKSTASTVVTRAKTASIPRAFFCPKSCSAPPEIAPDKPALFPDCNNTIAISPIESRISNVANNVYNIAPPYEKKHFKLILIYHTVTTYINS